MDAQKDMSSLQELLLQKEIQWSSAIMELEQLRRGMKQGASDVHELMQSELEKYKLIMRLSCDVFWDFYPNTMLTVFSPGFADCTGWNRLIYEDFEEFKGLVHPEDLPKFTDNIMGVLYGQQPGFNYEYRLLCADGQYCWFNNRCFGIRDDVTGDLVYILGLTHDFTHFRRQEAFLQEEKVKNQILLKTATDYIWEYDFEQPSLLFSRELADILGMQDVRIARDAAQEKGGLASLLHFVDSVPTDERLEHSRLHAHLQLRNSENNQLYWFEVASFPLCNVKGELYKLIGTMHDINEKKQLEDAVLRDPLTKAFNRRAAYVALERLHQSFVEQRANSGLFFIDVDNFKKVNDTYGHAAGDLVLQEMVAVIQKVSQHGAETYRWGGEEFLIILDYHHDEQLLAHAETVRRAVEAHTLRWQGRAINFTVSIGVSIFGEADDSYDAAVERADNAVYVVKSNKKNGVHYHPPTSTAEKK